MSFNQINKNLSLLASRCGLIKRNKNKNRINMLANGKKFKIINTLALTANCTTKKAPGSIVEASKMEAEIQIENDESRITWLHNSQRKKIA